ncbi:MAG: serine/threonine-protein kinase [Leptolyngbyaceae cyanobacterium bins.59]|nr:serine/threonine-protein kinase [Leptolyngbyaceae cyanobacterium bins.59]
MSNIPGFPIHDYQIEKVLGHNAAGGRVTYLAKKVKTREEVVIKQFQFAKTSSSWASYDTYEQEIQILRGLNHPGIPHYLDSFPTKTGFCMVQEYKPAVSLGEVRSFSPDEIKKIATSVLEILVYLQNRFPPVIHRDIKPENILVDAQIAVYLIDFGFARIGHGEVGISSVVKGTLGFMPPEQLFNRQLTEASDLYGLGVTLICLLTGTRSTDVGKLIDITYRVDFKPLVPRLNVRWANWLEKMVEPRLKDRYPNAVAALEALPDGPIYLPEIRLSQSFLEFKSVQSSEILTQRVTVLNPMASTHLEGQWEVATHPSDPSGLSTGHPWISIEPAQFSGNQVDCKISVNTSFLMSNQTYNRTLLLHTNSLPKTCQVNLQVRTAPLPIAVMRLPIVVPAILLMVCLGLGWFAAGAVMSIAQSSNALSVVTFSTIAAAAVGLEMAGWALFTAGRADGSNAAVISGLGLGVLAFLTVLSGPIGMGGTTLLLSTTIGLPCGLLWGGVMGSVVEYLIDQSFTPASSLLLSLLIATFATSLGITLKLNGTNEWLVFLTIGLGLTLFGILMHFCLQQARLQAIYRKAERHRIRP